MPKPKIVTTGYGGPCFSCGEYISNDGSSSMISLMEDHYLAVHNSKITKPQKKRRSTEKTVEMFDRKDYLRGHT